MPMPSLIAWFDARLQRRIHCESEDMADYWEARSIKEGPQPESSFVVPPGYSTL